MSNNVTGQVIGGTPVVTNDVDTVSDVFDALGLEGNYEATINGEPASMDDEVSDYSFVAFSEKVKGGL